MSKVYHKVINTRQIGAGHRMTAEQTLECGHVVWLKGREAKDAYLVERRKCHQCRNQKA